MRFNKRLKTYIRKFDFEFKNYKNKLITSNMEKVVPKFRIEFLRQYIPNDYLHFLLDSYEKLSFKMFTSELNVARANAFIQNGQMSPNSYQKFFKFAIWAEQFLAELKMEGFNMANETLRKCTEGKKGDTFILEVPGIIDRSPRICAGYTLKIVRCDNIFDMKVERVERHLVYITQREPTENFLEVMFPKQSQGSTECAVYFHSNQWLFQKMHQALHRCRHALANGILFPSSSQTMSENLISKNFGRMPRLKLLNPLIKQNIEQMKAIKNIVNGTSHPHPYIIFGPPGTGKTTTVVEAVIQVFQKDFKNRIVVMAPTNKAVDHIATLLLNGYKIRQDQILRLYSISLKHQAVTPELEKISLFGSQKPSKIMKYRIVCVTLGTCQQLINSNINKGFFSHFFIDEACQVSEPEILIPLVGLWSKKSHVILSGDPNQRNRIIFSDIAATQSEARILIGILRNLIYDQEYFEHFLQKIESPTLKDFLNQILDDYRNGSTKITWLLVKNAFYDINANVDPQTELKNLLEKENLYQSDSTEIFGFERSLMERLMDDKLYSKNKSKNSHFITRLVENVSSDPSLFDIYNRLFYKKELISNRNEAIVRNLKKIKKFSSSPLLFWQVENCHEKARYGQSLKNDEEAEFVVDYVLRLTKDGGIEYKDIGVIAFYRRQVREIRERFYSYHFPELSPKQLIDGSEKFVAEKGLTIGSVDEFQGQEKLAIVMSTVRSFENFGCDHLQPISKFQETQSIKFLADPRRFNVAISRAEALLVIFGDYRLLQKDETCWSELLKLVQKNNKQPRKSFKHKRSSRQSQPSQLKHFSTRK